MVNLANRHRSFLRSAVACAWLSLAATAGAQHGAIETCRQKSSDAERIACLEAALAAGGMPSDGRSRPASAPPRNGAAPAGNEGTPDDAATSAVDEARTPPLGSHPADSEAIPAGDTDIGARQLRARSRSEADLESASGLGVTGYTEVPYRRLQVTLENGQVWRQIGRSAQDRRSGR